MLGDFFINLEMIVAAGKQESSSACSFAAFVSSSTVIEKKE